MANEIRLRNNNISGTITDNPLAIGATTINSPGFADLPVVDATSHLILILDPLEVGGTAEIVKVTTHTAAATSVTVQRGQEGSVARSHVFNTTWFHGPTVKDFNVNSSSDSFITAGYAQVVASQTPITAEVDLTGLTVTVVLPANRRIKISSRTLWSATVASTVAVKINEGATELTQYQATSLSTNGVSTASEVIITPSAGSHTYKLRGSCTPGTGTMVAGALVPAYILVEDLGSVV